MLPGFQRAMEKVARDVRRAKTFDRVYCAYLEITPPSIEKAVAQAVEDGAGRVKILPYFLLHGRHTRQHIPAIAAELKKRFKKTRITLCPYLGYHPKIAQAVLERAGR
jgi:sirohydrochlorin cobaltochelatase